MPVAAFAIATEIEWQLAPRTDEPGRTVLGVDGPVMVASTAAADGTFTVTTLAAKEPPARRGGPPNNCPCTAIYSECRCPVRP